MSEPITPEWLESVGFRCNNQPGRCWARVHGITRVSVWPTETSRWRFSLLEDDDDYEPDRYEIEQDCDRSRIRALWFALTGEPLDPPADRDTCEVLLDWAEEHAPAGLAEAVPTIRQKIAPKPILRLRPQRYVLDDDPISCAHCRGTGYVPVSLSADIDCEACHGTGIVPAIHHTS